MGRRAGRRESLNGESAALWIEDPNSPLAQQRYFNKCDVLIEVKDSGVTGSSGSYNGFSTHFDPSSFVTTNKTFFNQREYKSVKVTEINMAAFKTWAEGNSAVKDALGGRTPASICVEDRTTPAGGAEHGVRLVNGQVLPANGLTVATPHPLYVQGHFNAPSGAVGTSHTSMTKPASLVGDAITILSGAWKDSKSTEKYTDRDAENTTVNAALIAGIVETSLENDYSGGVENFPRFLEDWCELPGHRWPPEPSTAGPTAVVNTGGDAPGGCGPCEKVWYSRPMSYTAADWLTEMPCREPTPSAGSPRRCSSSSARCFRSWFMSLPTSSVSLAATPPSPS